jgi:hypothetical protein
MTATLAAAAAELMAERLAVRSGLGTGSDSPESIHRAVQPRPGGWRLFIGIFPFYPPGPGARPRLDCGLRFFCLDVVPRGPFKFIWAFLDVVLNKHESSWRGFAYQIYKIGGSSGGR